MKIIKAIHKSMFLFFGLVVASNCFSQEFIHHIANSANTLVEYTKINHPLTNAHPEAILVITRVANLKKSKEPLQFGVEYKDGKWRILSKSGRGVPLNTVFIIELKNVPHEDLFTLSEYLLEKEKVIPIRNLTVSGDAPTKSFSKKGMDLQHGIVQLFISFAEMEIGIIKITPKRLRGNLVKFNVLVVRTEKPKSSSFQVIPILL
jgi:hypothetical protein